MARHERVMIDSFGEIKDVDKIELRRYCQLIIKIEQLRLAMDGHEVVSQGSGFKPNPLLSVIKETEYQAGMISNRLGLHLSGRQAQLKKVTGIRKDKKSLERTDDADDDTADDLEGSLSGAVPDAA